MQGAIAQHGAPEYIRSDNGSEFIAKELQRWLAENKIKTIYIEPGSPWQNGFVESFHGRFRDECLNREQLWTLTEARVVIEDLPRINTTRMRPHSQARATKARRATRRVYIHPWLRSGPPSRAFPPPGMDNQRQSVSTSTISRPTLRVARKGGSAQSSSRRRRKPTPRPKKAEHIRETSSARQTAIFLQYSFE